MTPKVLQQAWVGNLVYELSTGKGFLSDAPMYGVTVLKPVCLDLDKASVAGMLEAERQDDLSRCFFKLEAARDYIKTLENMDQEALFEKVASNG